MSCEYSVWEVNGRSWAKISKASADEPSPAGTGTNRNRSENDRSARICHVEHRLRRCSACSTLRVEACRIRSANVTMCKSYEGQVGASSSYLGHSRQPSGLGCRDVR